MRIAEPAVPVRPPLLPFLSGEPFRMFFPLGLCVGVIGLLLWPLFLWGAWRGYPALVHSRLMVEGFMGAFIFGFLGTAGPRLLGAPPLSVGEFSTILALYLASMTSHLAGFTLAGDTIFLSLLLTFVGVLGRRFARADELPPPNFVLVGLGMLSAIAGAVLVVATLGKSEHAAWYRLGTLLLNEGFILLPVLGVGVFLFPRFLCDPAAVALQASHRSGRAWRIRAWIAAATGAVIFQSFVLESLGSVQAGSTLRFCAATVYVATQMPRVLIPSRCPCLGQCIRLGTWMLLLGLLWPIFLPAYRVAGLHLLFIGGFMLVTLAVGTRVILGHSGQGHLVNRRHPFLITAGVMLGLGLLSRIGADFMPSMAGRSAHLIYAAWFCIGAAVIWGIRLFPRVLVPDTE